MPANVSVIIGAQWGDEGKGKLVDLLGTQCDVVCRCQGGNNAGHTVVTNGVHYDFHLLPSGIINEQAVAVIGNGVVINLPSLFKEIDVNKSKGLLHIEGNLRISDRAHLVLDLHQEIDGLHEKSLAGNNLGTTKKGIGPTYSSKAMRNGLRVCDLLGDWETFCSKYRRLSDYIRQRYPNVQVDVEADLNNYHDYRERLRPLVTDTAVLLHEMCSSPVTKHILVEGAQSCLLDIDFGTYPYVTSSNCSVGGVCTGLGLPPSSIKSIFGVVKAYTTRVGDGPFPTEQASDSEVGRYLQQKGHEVGVTTGRPRRCGWLDAVVVRYSVMVNGFTGICLTKLDVLDELKELHIAHEYLHPETGEPLTSFPADLNLLGRVRVVYEVLPGWQCPTSHCRSFAQLPTNAQTYVRRAQEFCGGVPIQWIGVGQAREAIIELGPNGAAMDSH